MVSDLLNKPRRVSSVESLSLMTILGVLGGNILNKTVSANGTVSCVLSRSYAARNGVISTAPRAYLVTQNPEYLTIHGQIAESGVVRVL